MPLLQPTETRRPIHRRRQSKLKPIVASAATLALGVSGVFLASGSASAAVPGHAEAQGRYLSGTLLDQSLDNLAELKGQRAVADGTTDDTVVKQGDLDLSVLRNLAELKVKDGITIPISVADAGVISQYAEASKSGASKASSGAVTSQVANLRAIEAPGDLLSFDLSSLLGDDITNSVAGLSLTAGADTASAEQGAGEDPQGDYNIASLRANLTSPVIAGLSDDLVASGNALDGTVANTIGPDGSFASGLTSALNTAGVADVDVSATTDLGAVVDRTVQANQILGADGPVQVNLTNGEITVDIAALLAAHGRDLNDLQPGEEILNSELVDFVTADVDELVNGLLGQVQTAVNNALATTELTVAASVDNDEGTTLLTLDLDGDLKSISTGATAPDITLLNGGVNLNTDLISTGIAQAAGAALSLQLNTNALDADLTPLYPAIDRALSNTASLRANVQETAGGTFTETALRLALLNYTADGQALSLNLAQAAVGPNAVPNENASPTVLGITPNSGPEAGGTTVTINGTDLTAVDTVSFGGVAGTDLTVNSPTEITVKTPAGTGVVDVGVSGTDGTATLSNAYTYTPAGGGNGGDQPGTVVSYTPTSGPEGGGTAVDIIGSGFTGADGVNFGNTPGTDFTVVSDTEITVTSPAGTGSVAVTVVGAPNGDIEAATPFTYVPENGNAIAVTGVSPTSGPEAGGTTVTITGKGLSTVDEVRFDGKPGTGMTVVSDGQLRVVTPAGVGQVPIALVDTTAGGNGTVTAPRSFSYIPASTTNNPPTVTSIDPTSGPIAGGTEVTIIGTNFMDGDTVKFGDSPAGSVTVVSDTEIHATTPGGTGVVDVSVTNGAGQTGTLPDAFTYMNIPAVDGNSDGGAIPGSTVNSGTDYQNCAAAAADGKVNFSSTDRNLDQDGDGIACEFGANGDGTNSNGTNGGSKNLAYTGSEGAPQTALIGLLMLLLGGVFVVFRRRFSA